MAGKHRTLTLVVAALAAAFFFTPIALRAVGVTAHCCPENRPFAPAPKLADGFNAFDDTTRFLVDRMPGRQQAIRANTWIDEHLYSSTPNYGQNAQAGAANDRALPFSGHAAHDLSGGTDSQQARPGAALGANTPGVPPTVAGKHNWLFLQQVFDSACHQYVPLSVAESRWIELLHLIRASGRKVVLAVPPDKSVVYPEFVASNTPNLRCSQRGERREWSLLSAARARRAGIIPLLAPLLAAKAKLKPPAALYPSQDTHWNSAGALTLPEAVVPALAPQIRVRPSEIANRGDSVPHTGDLTILLGAPHSAGTSARAIRRARGAPVIKGPALLLGDSYAGAAAPLLAPYFADLKAQSWQTDPQVTVDQLNAARTVVLESVERNFDYETTGPGYINAKLLHAVRQGLTHVGAARRG